jgi:lysophospholipase L1-like esterase
VRATNLAVGGARTVDVIRQATAADLAAADVVLVSVGSVDVAAGIPLDAYAADLTALLAALPADRTLFSDIAAVPGHGPYQDRFATLADARGFVRAPFEASFRAAGRLDVFAPDGLHLNSSGYGIWFDGLRDRLRDLVDHR